MSIDQIKSPFLRRTAVVGVLVPLMPALVLFCLTLTLLFALCEAYKGARAFWIDEMSVGIAEVWQTALETWSKP